MYIRWIPLVVLVAGCGRLRFGVSSNPDDAAIIDSSDARDGGGPTDALGEFADGCALLMRMDEPSWTGAVGEVHDDCGGNNGTAVGGITTIANGTRGRAGSFTGGTGCIEIADAANLRATTALTITAWVFPTGDPAASFGIVSKRVDYTVDTAYSVFLWTADQMYADIDTENDRGADQAPFPSAVWNQITVVYDGSLPPASRVAFYVDGALDNTVTETSPSITQFTSPLYVGCLPLGGPAQGFVGLIDDVAIWTRALTPGEVSDWYAQTHP